MIRTGRTTRWERLRPARARAVSLALVATVVIAAVIGGVVDAGQGPSRGPSNAPHSLRSVTLPLQHDAAASAHLDHPTFSPPPAWASQIIGGVGMPPLAFPTSSDGWFLGPGGLYHTTDGGASWTLAAQGNDAGDAIFFVDPSNGWMTTANDGILHTSDGGQSWDRLSGTGHGNDNNIVDLDFVSPTLGWATTDLGQVFETRDAGTTWARLTAAPPATTHVCFSSVTSGWAISGSGVARTADGGATWATTLKAPLGTIRGDATIACSGATVWALFDLGGPAGSVGSVFVLAVSTDAGLTWRNAIVSNDPGISSVGPGFGPGSDATGWIASPGGHVVLADAFSPAASNLSPAVTTYVSTDAGQTFASSTVFDGLATVDGLTFTSASVGWIVVTPAGSSSAPTDFYETTDGGLDWVLAGSRQF